MSFEPGLLLWIHGWGSPGLDRLFLVSDFLGSQHFCIPLCLALILLHLRRREYRAIVAWVALGVMTYGLPVIIKLLVERPRPTLWPWQVLVSGLSFPSGHAVAGATFFPLLGYLLFRSAPGWGRVAYLLGLLPALVIGVGRLYLGVHWPTDVLAGWALGVAQSAAAVLWLTQTPLSEEDPQLRGMLR
jgi:membrane-associated phospholipid phosphatase